MTKLKTWIDGAGQVTKEEATAMIKTTVEIYKAKVENLDSWSWLNAHAVSAEEIAQRVAGDIAWHRFLPTVWRWILQRVNKTDKERLIELLPYKHFVRLADMFEAYHGFYNDGTARYPKDEYEMRISTNSRGGALWGILICDADHPLKLLVDNDYFARTDKSKLVADQRRNIITPPLLS
jgi:hypothetical protein